MRFLVVVGSIALAILLLVEPVLAATVPVLVRDGGAFSASSRLVFRNPRGLQRYYQFYYYGGDFTWWYAFSADAVHWSVDHGAADGGLGSGSLWVYDDGSQLVVYFVITGLINAPLYYLRGTIADTAEAISWSAFQTIDAGGSNARNFGVGVTRTAGGRPVITEVKEIFVNPGYRYEVRAWGADSDSGAPRWTRVTLVAASNSVSVQNSGFTSAYAVSGDYVSVAASAARGLNPSSPWDVSWVRASWNGATWSVGPVTVLRSGESAARPPSLVVDESSLPQALVAYPTGPNPQLVHYKGTTMDGTLFQTYVLSSQIVSVSTLTIDRSVSPSSLKAIYHYESTNVYWRSSIPTFSWGPENTIGWSQNATDLCSSQREFVKIVHGCAETSSSVYYFSL